MRRIALIVLVSWMIGASTLLLAEDIDGRAVIGGAVGGGLGAATGSYLGGRDWAVVGSAVGAAAGTALATRDDERKQAAASDHKHGDVVYIASDGKKQTAKKSKGCPPGLRMQGRC